MGGPGARQPVLSLSDEGQTNCDDNSEALSTLSHHAPLHHQILEEEAIITTTNECVRVAVRIRPLLASEQGSDTCIQVLSNSSLKIGGSSGPRFTFDYVFDTQSNQQQLFQACVLPLVDSCLQGYHATILAYGQTGSGKTHTIMGPHATTAARPSMAAAEDVAVSAKGNDDNSEAGVLPRALHAIFGKLDEVGNVQVSVQFLELYGEAIRDLLAPSGSFLAGSPGGGLAIRDLGGMEGTGDPVVVGASWESVESVEQALRCMQKGLLRRVTGATAMNETSSRSHALLTVRIEQSKDDALVSSKFHFVDLAGSERQKRTQTAGQRLKEGIDINKGLLVLGNVISALGDPAKRNNFVPYRDSKLTRLLRTSLGGNCKTLVMACVSPSADNLEESIGCLRYANRAKNITNQAIMNIDAQSQKLQLLQQTIQLVASDWVRVQNGYPAELAIDLVESLAQSGVVTTPMAMSSANGFSPRAATYTPLMAEQTARQYTPIGVVDFRGAEDERASDLQAELNRLRHELRTSQRNHDRAEEHLYVTKAEKELLSLQLSVVQSDNSGRRNPANAAEKDAFLAKATEYETQLGQLRNELRDAQAKARHLTDWRDNDHDEALEAARRSVDRDRQRLSALKASVPMQEIEDPQLALERLEYEEEQAQAQLVALTSIYLNHYNEDDPGRSHAIGLLSPQPQENPGRQRIMQADLVELARSIAAKEDLIDQLKLSQEKYASMRDFYEDRLHKMETALDKKETEREQLLVELERTKQEDKPINILEGKLREKELHIANLKKKQRELRDLTSVSSRNDSEINRLQSDVQEMKRKKVDLQKQIGEERKAHATEVRRLHQSSLQKEKEVDKFKMISSKETVKAEKASQLAKNRLEEIGALRSKYKDAEKRIRMLSLKHGVMAKAGLDSVLVGRRGSQDKKYKGQISQVDADSLRDYFDEKVAEVARKEALANKLAEEWEEHFELSNKKDKIEKGDDCDLDDTVESLAIQIQYKEERIRQLARRLGKQDSTSQQNVSSAITNDAFLLGEEFEKVTAGLPNSAAKNAAITVLFGMIVRERRRVASLAKSASSLDEQLQASLRVVGDSEAALRSMKDEHRQDIAVLTQNKQEHILSLMDMVSEAESDVDGKGEVSRNGRDAQLLILANERILALEEQLHELCSDVKESDAYRITVENLHVALDKSRGETADLEEMLSTYRSAFRQLRELAGQEKDRDELIFSILDVVKSTLHPFRDSPSSKRRSQKSLKSRSSRHLGVSPRVRRHVELMHTSDSGDDIVEPGWATDIMADLALIAEGKVPPSLEGLADLPSEAILTAKYSSPSDVIEHHDPGTEVSPNAKGGQNADASRINQAPAVSASVVGNGGSPTRLDKGSVVSTPNQNLKQRRAISRDAFHKLDKLVIPASTLGVADQVGSFELSSDQRGYKSVFDRLVSPSQYTGTQKEKFHENQSRKDLSAQKVADRLLDDLLKSDSEGGDSPYENERATGRSQIEEYTQQDVFERLHWTTTQSYAVKHNGVHITDHHHGHEGRSPVLSTAVRDTDTALSDSVKIPELASAYTQQNVFERLQKTTTEAYSKKTSRSRRSA